MRLPAASLALLLALSPAVVAQASYAPANVLALPVGLDAVRVAWTPGEEIADSYRVFGLAPEGWRFLDERPASDPLTVQVPAGFAEYGVAGVLDNAQSPIIAASIEGRACIWIDTTPPGFWIECGLPVQVQRPGNPAEGLLG